MIKELDVVRLTKDLPEKHLRQGMEGTVHQVYDADSPVYLIEFSDDAGVTLAILTLPADAVELIWSAPTVSGAATPVVS